MSLNIFSCYQWTLSHGNNHFRMVTVTQPRLCHSQDGCHYSLHAMSKRRLLDAKQWPQSHVGTKNRASHYIKHKSSELPSSATFLDPHWNNSPPEKSWLYWCFGSEQTLAFWSTCLLMCFSIVAQHNWAYWPQWGHNDFTSQVHGPQRTWTKASGSWLFKQKSWAM